MEKYIWRYFSCHAAWRSIQLPLHSQGYLGLTLSKLPVKLFLLECLDQVLLNYVKKFYHGLTLEKPLNFLIYLSFWILDRCCKLSASAETVVKLMKLSDYWVVGKMSDDRECYFILQAKNAALSYIHGKSILYPKIAQIYDIPIIRNYISSLCWTVVLLWRALIVYEPLWFLADKKLGSFNMTVNVPKSQQRMYPSKFCSRSRSTYLCPYLLIFYCLDYKCISSFFYIGFQCIYLKYVYRFFHCLNFWLPEWKNSNTYLQRISWVSTEPLVFFPLHGVKRFNHLSHHYHYQVTIFNLRELILQLCSKK